MKQIVITLTEQEYEQLNNELHELQSYRFNDDSVHFDDCISQSLITIAKPIRYTTHHPAALDQIKKEPDENTKFLPVNQ